MMTRDIGRDAPWIEDAERNGFGGTEDAFDKASENDLVQAADDEFGWRILAWYLEIDPDEVQNESDYQSVWKVLMRNVRVMHINAYRKNHEADLREWYNEWAGGGQH